MKRLGGRVHHQLSVLVARRAGPGVGVARIDDDAGRSAAIRCQRCAVELDRRRYKLVLGEYRCTRHRPAIVGSDHCHIEAALLYSGVQAGRHEAFGRGDAHG